MSATEREILHLFECALARAADERESWLLAQQLKPQTLARVRRLLEHEEAVGAFLEAPAHAPETVIPRLPEAGERVGPYALVRLIEAGGMGVVYLGRRADDTYEQQVAIKLVQPLYLAGDPALRERLVARFEEERAILAQLHHPNIARILDGGSTASGVPYLVMEFVDGVALTDYCRNHDLDVEQRLRLFCKVCDGVQDAHRHLIVHRDLKPDNVLVGSDGEPRLLDFGIAKLLDPGRHVEGSHEPTAFVAMTPAYASPEQVRLQPITTRSDVYSLGVMLYQLLAEVRPHELGDVSPAEAERRVCEIEPESLKQALQRSPLSPAQRRQRQAAITGDLDKIVAKALHKQADRRYGSAQELADDLQRYLDGHPVRAHADTGLYRMGKFLQRNRLAVAAAALALSLILVAAGIAFEQARQARLAAADSAEINRFLIDILARSDPDHGGEEVTLGQALDAAANQVELRFGSRPALAAGVRYAIGYSMLSRYRLDPAQVQIERGLREAQQAFGPNDIRTLELLEAQALLRQYQGQTGAAIDLFKTVLERLRESAQTRTPLHVVTHNDLGVLYLNQPDYVQAHEHIRLALDGIEHDGVRVSDFVHAQALGNLAHALHGLDDLDSAEALYRRSGELLAKVYPDGSRDVAILLNNRALLANDQGRIHEALVLLRESVAMRKRVFREDHPSIVFALSNLTQQALIAGNPELALDSAQDAVAMAERLDEGAREERVMAASSLARVHIAGGDPARAAESLRRAEGQLAELTEAPQRLLERVDQVRDELCQLDSDQPGC